MNLLFAIDDNFVQQLETVLLSIHLNTKSQEFNIYVLQKNRLTKEAELAAFCKHLKMAYHPVMVKQSLFENAPVTDHERCAVRRGHGGYSGQNLCMMCETEILAFLLLLEYLGVWTTSN